MSKPMDQLVSMSLRRLRAFLVVCDTLHIGRAAQHMGIAQPALSQQIRSLEAALGVPLFHRRKRGIDLTEAGAAYREEATRLLAAHKGAAEIARRTARGELGSLSIGYVTSAMFGSHLPALLGRMHAGYPDVRVSLVEGGIADIMAALKAGEIDVAFVRAPLQVPAGHASRVVVVERLMAAIPAGHRHAAKRSLTLAELAEEPMIGFNDAADVGIGRIIADLAARSGVSFRADWRVSAATSLLGLAAAGLGWGFVPDSLAGLPVPGVAFREIEGGIEAPLWVIWRGDPRPPTALRNLLALLDG